MDKDKKIELEMKAMDFMNEKEWFWENVFSFDGAPDVVLILAWKSAQWKPRWVKVNKI